MTRRDYVALAEGLLAARPENYLNDPGLSSRAIAQWEKDVRTIANVLARDNGRFDRGRFYRACGADIEGTN